MWPLWQALHDLLVQPEPEPPGWSAGPWPADADAGSTPVVRLSPHAATGCAAMAELWTALRRSHGNDEQLQVLVLRFVSHRLACRGYTPAEAWAADLRTAAALGSKELLLALGWLLATSGAFGRYEAAVAARLAELAPLLPPYAHTASALPCPAAGMAAAAAAAHRATGRISRCLQGQGGELPELERQTAQLLAEVGRVLLTARELGALQCERARLAHRLQLLFRRIHRVRSQSPIPDRHKLPPCDTYRGVVVVLTGGQGGGDAGELHPLRAASDRRPSAACSARLSA